MALQSLMFQAEPAILLGLQAPDTLEQIFKGLTITNAGRGRADLIDLRIKDEVVDELADLGPLYADCTFECPCHGLVEHLKDGRIPLASDFLLVVRYSDSFGRHWARRFTMRLLRSAVVPGAVRLIEPAS